MKPLFKLLPYIKPHLRWVIASCVLAIPLAALRFSPAPFIKYLIDDLLATRDTTKLFLFQGATTNETLWVIALAVLNSFISLYYYQEATMKQIGAEIGVNESRAIAFVTWSAAIVTSTIVAKATHWSASAGWRRAGTDGSTASTGPATRRRSSA